MLGLPIPAPLDMYVRNKYDLILALYLEVTISTTYAGCKATLVCSMFIHMSVMPEPGGPGGPLAPPIFFRSFNPIGTGEGKLSPPITTGTPNVFHLPAALTDTLYGILYSSTFTQNF